MARNRLISREGPTHQGIVIDDYTSIGVYMAAGAVFVLGFTLSVVLTAVAHMEMMVWPAWALTFVLTAVTFFGLRARELRQKAAQRPPRDE